MTRKIIFLSALLVLSACSGDSNESAQLTEIRSNDVESQSIGASSDQRDKQVDNLSEPVTTKSLENINKSSSASLEKNNQADEQDPEIVELLAELDESLKGYDDAAIINAYGVEGSSEGLSRPFSIGFDSRAVAIDHDLKHVKLMLQSSNIESNVELLTKDVESISGVTGITSDPSGFGFSVDLSGDYMFEFDEFELNNDARFSLEKIWVLYQKYDGKSINVIGHTDSKGSEDYNLSLSKKRASSVKNWFINKGLQPKQVESTGMGESQPVSSNTLKDGADNPEGRALNRRVSISIKTSKTIK